jgi:DNA-binding MarR family transcriptional regulator
MSSPEEPLIQRKPLIAIVERAARVLGTDMIREVQARGHTQIRLAYNAVFATLPEQGARTSDMAARAGITKQSMGEVVREMVGLGLLEMTEDPEDRRAKLVTYTDAGLAIARDGRRYMLALEQEWADKFGEAEFDTARDVLYGIVDLMGGWD